MTSRLCSGRSQAHWKPPLCWDCRHRARKDAKCTAFPDGIPWEILDSVADHRHPFPGDQGIRFEPKAPVAHRKPCKS
jgi:hypothetical protein